MKKDEDLWERATDLKKIIVVQQAEAVVEGFDGSPGKRKQSTRTIRKLAITINRPQFTRPDPSQHNGQRVLPAGEHIILSTEIMRKDLDEYVEDSVPLSDISINKWQTEVQMLEANTPGLSEV